MAQFKEIYLAGGCFWGTEHYFKQIRGVVETEVGFANGHHRRRDRIKRRRDKRPERQVANAQHAQRRHEL